MNGDVIWFVLAMAVFDSPLNPFWWLALPWRVTQCWSGR